MRKSFFGQEVMALVISAVLAIALAGCSAPAELTDAALLKAALSGTYKLGGDTVKLTAGSGVWDKPALGDLNGDGWKDAALIVTKPLSGTGVSYYLAVHEQSKTRKSPVDVSAVHLGDAVEVRSLAIKDNSIVVSYADRSKGVPMTSKPDIVLDTTFKVAGTELKQSSRQTYISFEKYIPCLGMTKAEVIQAVGEEPTTIDEGGVDFAEATLRMWFDENGKVRDILFGAPDVDFNGARYGQKFDAFHQAFGEWFQRDENSAYAVFRYQGIDVDVDYDPKTQVIASVHILTKWK